MVHGKKHFNRYDAIVAGVLAFFTVFAFFALCLPRSSSRTFTVQTDTGTKTYPLSHDCTFEVTSNGITLVITVCDNSVAVTSADCPDHVCVNTGKISTVGQAIVCIPARVVIAISAKGGATNGSEDADFTVG